MTEKNIQEYLLKRKVVLETLEMLFGYWDMSESLYNIVNSINVSREIIDEIINLIEISYKNINDNEKKKKMEFAINSLKKFSEEELNEKSTDLEKITIELEEFISFK